MMQQKKRTFCGILAILLVFSSLFSLAACSNETGKPGSETTDTEKATVYTDLISGTETNYVVMRSETASDVESNATLKLRNAIAETTGIDILLSTDWIIRGEDVPATGFEILVGNTNRPESDISALNITSKDFYIGRIGDRIVIRGLNDATTTQAVDYFIENYVKDGKVTIPEDINFTWLYKYPASDILLNGISYTEYKIVYAKDAYGFGELGAKALQENISSLTGKTIDIIPDTEAETANEILLGDTNRAASGKFPASDIEDLKYEYAADGTKIVINSPVYLLTGAANGFAKILKPKAESDKVEISVSANATVDEIKFERTKNIIVLIADGMGFNHIKYALENGMEGFAAELLPYHAQCKTFSADNEVTDSAAAATALSGGYKTDNYTVGRLPDGTDVPVLGELATSLKKDVIIATTDDITAATPAGFTAHAGNRSDTSLIAKCQKNLNLFYSKGSILLTETKATYQSILDQIDVSNNPGGFFMMYEEAYTDKAAHGNDFENVYKAMVRFNEVVVLATDYVLKHPDTTLIVTADHETGGIQYTEETGWIFTETGHTSANVPLFALGFGTEVFDGLEIDNTEVAKFCAYLMGEPEWGDQTLDLTISLPKLK